MKNFEDCMFSVVTLKVWVFFSKPINGDYRNNLSFYIFRYLREMQLVPNSIPDTGKACLLEPPVDLTVLHCGPG